MSDERTIEARIYERLSKVIDPELQVRHRLGHDRSH